MRLTRLIPAAVAALALGGGPRCAAAEPLLSLSDDGQTFLYRSRAGDRPAAVAGMFDIAPADLPAFLAANRIADPTRVESGFVYRIPNLAARHLAERVTTLTADNDRLEHALKDAEDRARSTAQEATDATARAAASAHRLTRADRLETLWSAAQAIGILLFLIASAATAVAVAAVRRQRQAERFARTLNEELESRRRAALLERQEATRRVLELEARARSLEVQLGPRVLLGGR